MANMKIASINTRGLNNTRKRISVFKWISDNHLDIIFVQETYCVQKFESIFSRQWNGEIYHSFTNSKHARGVCIMLSRNVSGSIISTHNDNLGRKLLLNVTIDDNMYTLVNVYCPTNLPERARFS